MICTSARDAAADLAEAALGRLPTARNGLPRTCRHLTPARLGLVCAIHPDRVRCLTCAWRHARGHGVELEHTCDLCHRVDLAGLWGLAVQLTHPSGVRVLVGSLGACDTCGGRRTP